MSPNFLFVVALKRNRSVTHTAGRRDGRQKGRESGYYNLHRNLNKTLLHKLLLTSYLLHQTLVDFQSTDFAARQCSSKLGIALAAPSVHVAWVAAVATVAARLGEYLACDRTRLAVLDGDSLHGGRIHQSQLL